MQAGPMKPLEFFMQYKQKLRFKKQMHALYDFKSGHFSAPVPWLRSSGSEQEKRGEVKNSGRQDQFYLSNID